MERLNYDSIVYQSAFTMPYTLGIENNPKHGGTSINPEDFNVYGVDFLAGGSLVFHVNGKRHLFSSYRNGTRRSISFLFPNIC